MDAGVPLSGHSSRESETRVAIILLSVYRIINNNRRQIQVFKENFNLKYNKE